MTDKPQGFSEKLQWLIGHVPSPRGGPFSDQEIAEAVGVSKNYVWRLKHDASVNNPSLKVTIKLARLFGVGLDFFDEKESGSAEHLGTDELLNKMIAKKALGELDHEDRVAILAMIDHLIKSRRK